MNDADFWMMRCPACGAKNRIPKDKAGQTGTCGKCKSHLDTKELLIKVPLTITDADMDAKVRRSPIPVLLDCWAPWCGPCKTMGPILSELARDLQGKVRVAKLNVDQNQATANAFNIMTIPTLLIFDNGRLKDTITGAVPKPVIMEKLFRFL